MGVGTYYVDVFYKNQTRPPALHDVIRANVGLIRHTNEVTGPRGMARSHVRSLAH